MSSNCMTVPSKERQNALKAIPGVDRMLERALANPVLSDAPKAVITDAIRETLEAIRYAILHDTDTPPPSGEGKFIEEHILQQVRARVTRKMTPNLRRVINATGVVVHTNLGRSLLAEAATKNILQIAERYSNLEFDLDSGKRGSRYSAVEGLLCALTGAESAMVVNNNAAAVLLCLNTIAREKQVVVSRGELVEIGGAFRIPDVMNKSGAVLKEVGTTNRTHLKDYESAIVPETGLLLKVHTSNFSVVGFSKSVSLKELVALGKSRDIPVMEDLGSGTLVDFSKYGLAQSEPTVKASVAAGADIVTFSGDKLLGGPQAGIILGRKPIIDAVRQNSLTRALRIDKLTLAGLESTLRLYIDEKKAVSQIPTLRMLSLSLDTITAGAHALADALNTIGDSRLTVHLLKLASKVGGGALPLLNLPTVCVGISITPLSAQAIELFMRRYRPPIIGRIETDIFLMDPRTIQEDEPPVIVRAVKDLLEKPPVGSRS